MVDGFMPRDRMDARLDQCLDSRFAMREWDAFPYLEWTGRDELFK